MTVDRHRMSGPTGNAADERLGASVLFGFQKRPKQVGAGHVLPLVFSSPCRIQLSFPMTPLAVICDFTQVVIVEELQHKRLTILEPLCHGSGDGANMFCCR